MDQYDDRSPEKNEENLDEDMERDAEIRRDTQVRGSLGIPPGGNASRQPGDDEAVPEFDRGSDEDRMSER
jgi:hypothetical protein